MGKKKRTQGDNRARKSAKRRQRSVRASTPKLPASRRAWLSKARSWPIHEVVVSSNWAEEAQLATVVVARRSSGGTIVAAMFLVDRCCLGVKNAFSEVFANAGEYDTRFRARFIRGEPMVLIELDLAAKIVRTSVSFARDLGFRPSADYKTARLLLEGADSDRCRTDISTGGPDGKPLYIAGPEDDVRRIMTHLRNKLGLDGFHYIAPPEALDGWE